MSIEPPLSHDMMDRAVIHSWARGQIAPWLMEPARRGGISDKLHHLNATEANIFLFQMAGGAATQIPRPASILPNVSGVAIARAAGYWMWLDTLARERLPEAHILLAIYVGDGTLEAPDVPIFSFQKSAGNASLLLPDPDLLGHQFPTLHDETAYLDKAVHATFSGPTTGGVITTQALLRDGAIARIRSALFFRNQPDVDFQLSELVQYDTDETAALLRTMGFGRNPAPALADQLRSRFIISMDGNGAACSGVSVPLSSNSALLKYASPHELYYFAGLRPWQHFIPIVKDSDVLRVVQIEREAPGFFADIARAGQDFTHRFLTRDAAMEYTAALVRLYAAWLADPIVPSAPEAEPVLPEPVLLQPGAQTPPPPPPSPTLRVHIQDHGDATGPARIWSGLIGTGQSIEGFALEPIDGLDAAYVQCQSLNAAGTLSALHGMGLFTGSTGQNQPIYGFAIHLAESIASVWRCEYWGRFSDGSEVGPVAAGVTCRADQICPLEAMRISFVPK